MTSSLIMIMMSKLSLTIGLALFSSLTCCHAWEDFASMSMQPGDKIGCKLHGFLGYFGYKHWMLAAGDKRVVHMIGDAASGSGWVRRQRLDEVPPDMFLFDKCVNAGSGPNDAGAVQVADPYVDHKMTYSLLFCNCSHYVNYWANGGNFCGQDV